MNITRNSARLLIAPAAALGLAGATVLLGAGAASAHVGLTGTSTAAGSSSVLSFGIGHGCDGSPTTRVAISIPEEIVSVTPQRAAFWEVEKVTEQLDEPITDAHGNEITERVSQVVFTATTPLPDDQRDTLELSLRLPDAAGETIAFPTVQSCEVGEHAWTEVAAEGQDSHDLESPAPTLTLTAGGDDGHDHGDSDDHGGSGEAGHDSDGSGDSASGDESSSGGSNALAISGLVAGILGLIAGGAALLRSRSQA